MFFGHASGNLFLYRNGLLEARFFRKGAIMAKQKNCSGNPVDHQGHLCVLAGIEDFEGIRALVRDPRFICFNCGRVADKAANLCNPMPLEQDGT